MDIQLLFWIYLVNAIILIVHEIDSAYWQEWKLLKPDEKNGINGFLILHFPIIFAVLYGLTLIDHGAFAGYIFSIFLAISGIYAFFFHFYFLQRGRPEFNTQLSKGILITSFAVSVFQLGLTIYLMILIN
jgi:hypothetical protein